jgi:DMSO/TMAO reductase YedYZ molybdopterin-dependent catalytic subunit
MASEVGRRELLRGTLAAAGLGALGLSGIVLPVLAQGETLVPFTDMPENVPTTPGPDRRIIDVRKINGPFTPRDQFYTTQHYGHPQVDPAAFHLKVTGLVDRTLTLPLDEIKKMKSTDLIAGFECSGNRKPLQGLIGNGRWTGVTLKSILEKAGVKTQAREFVFFGADHGEEEIEWRTQKFKLEQQFGRSLTREQVGMPEILLAYAMNGEPLTVHQGAPLRLVVPGWYGVANVKWLSQIHAQEDQYLGKFQARWYRTLRGEMIDGEMKWKESAVTRQQLKSFIARVSKTGSAHKVFGVVLTDGTPIRSVEVKVDDGPWQPATVEANGNKFAWKFFTYNWEGAKPGDHTIVSRVTDAKGAVQPTEQALETKKSFLEDNSQMPRKLTIA